VSRLISSGSTTTILSRREKDAIVARVRSRRNLMTEIEFEWLRQWSVQGRRHASLHPYWHGPISELCDAYRKLQRLTYEVLRMLNFHKDGTRSSWGIVTEDLFDVLIESFAERSSLRAAWHERYSDPTYADVPEDERPFSCHSLDRMMDKDDDHDDDDARDTDGGGRLPEDLDAVISRLRRLRLAFVSAEEQKSNADDRIKSEVGGSKREHRRV